MNECSIRVDAERESYLVEPVFAKRKARDPTGQDDEFLVELKRVKESEQPIVDTMTKKSKKSEDSSFKQYR